ncbi:hypothetical protein AYO49_00470 [Verrucomicrobiaceae bacterium SCGC AG-212-N21]|nr:hypothetical protein AYO49_00470 [Verrucomicrobiaceae bacterium SCGC AG-212-N21]
MINPFKEINWKPNATELRKFAISLLIGFPCIAVFFFLVRWVTSGAMPGLKFFLMLGGIGAAVGVVCLLVPVIARPLYYVWYAVTACIGIVMANLLFALLYYGLFAPLGLFMRLRGRDALKLNWQRGTSHWHAAPTAPPAEHYLRQY